MKSRLFISLLVVVCLAPFTNAQAAPLYAFPISDCKVTYAHSHHDYPATDILGKKGCSFVAVTAGVVDEVNRIDRYNFKTNKGADRGGLYVSIIGTDGVRYYGSHLRKGSIPAEIVPGLSVAAGTTLGLVGATGSARGTAPHLHFGISWPTPGQANVWWVRRGSLKPFEYLKAWQAGNDLAPSTKLAKVKYFGTIPPVPKN